MFEITNNKSNCVDIFRENINGSIYTLDFANTSNKISYGVDNGKWGVLEI